MIDVSKALLILSVFIGGSQKKAFGQSGVGEGLQDRTEFIKVVESKEVKVFLKYGTTENFMQENMYGEFNSCYLHKEAFTKFQKAITHLKELRPSWRFVLFDCLRPRSIQYKLWEKVKGTSKEPYVANPAKGSIHNYGFALDLSLLDESGKELDMGTAFDDFTPLAEPIKEEAFLKSGKLNSTQISNRKILKTIMIKAGFIQRLNEWWHYDALSGLEVRKRFRIIE